MASVDEITYSPGVIVHFCGGVGNQLFQLAAGYIAAKKYNCPLYIYNFKYKNHRNKMVDYFESIYKNIGIHIPDTYFDRFLNVMFSGGPVNNIFNYSHQFFITTEPYSIDNLSIPIMFNQFFQFYPPLKPYERDIRQLYMNAFQKYTDAVSLFYPQSTNSIFLHIRRGDYLLHGDKHPVLPISYYEEGLSRFDISSLSNIFVFSDDIKWAKQQPLLNENPKVVFIDNEDELLTLAFMAMCKKGAICANSSFSWWGAFLGAYESRNPIFVPNKWIGGHSKIVLFPEEWNILHVS